ncbi:MAG TPA: hypothetical protein VN380_08785 [Thermoanaerobaculia bacterium]|jgi:hypothetical protein|nr:hypothetical protein [Thermoanaerobaculia bacterium]
MKKKNSGKTNTTVPQPGSSHRVVDPAERYYEQSRKDRDAYKKAVSLSSRKSSWPDNDLAERNHVLGQDGNPQSRSAFDFRTFRGKS